MQGFEHSTPLFLGVTGFEDWDVLAAPDVLSLVLASLCAVSLLVTGVAPAWALGYPTPMFLDDMLPVLGSFNPFSHTVHCSSHFHPKI
jgi:hypothetical protein